MFQSTRGRGGGQWWPMQYSSTCLTATFYCPDCGKPMSLKNHTILDDGSVRPSVVCPNDVKPILCKFHDFVKLNGFSNVKINI